ncbi:MAG: NAD(P)/FAD-dependent oxidoreductase [Lachnospiraceae bacterium]|nr:NAD(P)/FAD-dependent oxidoreductase [Lachnospiraceae bacterium]
MNVLIIGGGASGMVAALTAAKSHNVTILEQRDRIGHKLLATGNGKCNMTNADQSLSHYHGLLDEEGSRMFAARVLKRFGKEEVLSFFMDLGILPKEKNGYIYPNSEQASAVLDVLRFALKQEKVRTICDAGVNGIEKKGDRFLVKTSQGEFQADRVILCTGSKAGIPRDQATGYRLASDLSHKIIDPLPALVQLCSDEKICKGLAGIRLNGTIRLYEDDTLLDTRSGEIQFTNYGISGIPTMQLSYLAAKKLSAHKKVKVSLDLLPDHTEEDCLHILQQRKELGGYKTAEQFLTGIFHKNLGICLMKSIGISLSESVSKLSDQDLSSLCKQIKSFELQIRQTRPFSDAQVCAGGIDLNEVKDTLESKLVPGLYFAGEILDINGDCGGYNLQWAFSSGMLAGQLEN